MDIVARLRDPILFNFDAYDLCDEAADEIERLRNKVQWLELVENTVVKQDKKIERLREVLKEILTHETDYEPYDCIEIARAALKEIE